MKKYIHPVELYTGKMRVVFAKDINEVIDKYELPATDSYDAFMWTDKHGPLVAFEVKKDLDFTTVAHEAVHIVNFIYVDHCIKVDAENDEPYAYLLQWVVGRILFSWGKYKKTKQFKRKK